MSVNSENGSSKTDTLIKVVLVFFISLLSFSVGTFVGHQFSKSEQRRMALEGEYKAERSVASTGEATGEEEKISEKEVESLTEEFVNKEKVAGTEGHETAGHETAGHETAGHEAGEHETAAAESKEAVTAEHGAEPKAEADGYKSYPRGKTAANTPAADAHGAPAVAATAHAPEHGAEKPAEKTAAVGHAAAPGKTSPAADKLAHNQAPTDGAKEVRKPASTLPAVASSAIGKYTVQVASYAEEGEAKTHAAALKGKGWSAFYVPATVAGRTWYRVSVGIYDSNKAASDARAQFMKDTSSKSALVQKIVQ